MQVLVSALPLTCKLNESFKICEGEEVGMAHYPSVPIAVLGGSLPRLWGFQVHCSE